MKALAKSSFDAIVVLGYLLSGIMLSAWTLNWIAGLVFRDWQFDTRLRLQWIVALPLAYVVWLIWFLAFSCVEFHVLKLLLRYEKRSRECSADGLRCYIRFYGSIFIYLKMRLVYSLPLVPALVTIPIVRHLVFRSYAATDRIQHGSLVLGLIFDPDLTEVAEGAVVGSGAVLVAHAMTTNADGSRVLVTAPIVIGPRAVIGGGSKVMLGSVVGADVIVEAMSFVAAWTTIGPGEVWGGNPAVFRRHRPGVSSNSATQMTAAAMPKSTDSPNADINDVTEETRRALALAFKIPVENINDEFGHEDCPDEWDSLGQMAIAAAVHNLTGVEIPAERRFKVFKFADVADCIRTARSNSSRAVAAASSMLTCDGLRNDALRAELLPLEDHAVTTRLLAKRAADGLMPTITNSMTITFAATFVVDPLFSSLRLWCRAFGIDVKVASAGFDQIPQALLNPASPLRSNAGGISIVLVRTEDLGAPDVLAARAESLLNAIRSFAEDCPGMLIVGSLPPVVSAVAESDQQSIEQLHGTWLRTLGDIRGIQVLDVAGVMERAGRTSAISLAVDQQNGIPYSAEVFDELGIALARVARERRVPPAKVLALDADGVLWGGVAAEDGESGIVLGGSNGMAFVAFQRAVLELKQRGVLLAIVSRNDPEDVRRIFEHHPGMVLQSTDIAAWRVNWNAKSVNLRDIAAELNLAIDSVVFIDDDEVNRLEVMSSTPEVLVLPLTDNPTSRTRMLSQLWCFDAVGRTADDFNRTQMMLAEAERKTLQSSVTTLADYLKSLELRVRMRGAVSVDFARVAQLTQKTNQFNLSLRRRSESEIATLVSNACVEVVEAVDRFGDYGMIGVCITTTNPTTSEALTIDTLLLSCRALGRGIEDAVLARLAQAALADGLSTLEAPFERGPRNQPMREFLHRVGFEHQADGRFLLPIRGGLEFPSHLAFTAD